LVGEDPPPPGATVTYDDDTAEFPPPQIDAEEVAGLHGGSGSGRLGPPMDSIDGRPIQDEPSGMVGQYLFPTEKFRGEWKKHWIYLIKEILIAIVATLLMGWITGYLAKHNETGPMGFAIVLWIGVLCYVGVRVLDWWYDRFVLTNKRIMVIKGFVKRSVGMMPLVRVTDMKYEQSAMGRLLRYGTFVVESAGQDQALRTVKPLPNPGELYLRIVEEMYEPEAVEARLSRSAEEAGGGDA